MPVKKPKGGLFGLSRAISRPSLLALALAFLALLSGPFTYAILTGIIPYTPTQEGMVILLLVNLTLGLSLGALIGIMPHKNLGFSRDTSANSGR